MHPLQNYLEEVTKPMTNHDDTKIYYQEVTNCTECPMTKMEYVFLCSWDECPLPSLTDIEKLLKYVDKNNNHDVCGNCQNWKYIDFDHSIKKDFGYCQSYEEEFPCDDPACEDYKPI